MNPTAVKRTEMPPNILIAPWIVIEFTICVVKSGKHPANRHRKKVLIDITAAVLLLYVSVI